MDILQTAKKEMGVSSDINGRVNPRLLDYFKKIGIPYESGDDQVWCAAFVGFILETCGIRSTRSLAARSYLNWGTTVTKPVQGDVVVFWRDSVASQHGHVSFYHHEDENTVYCLGGNQGSGEVDIGAYPKTRVLGYRRPITSNPQTHMEPHENQVTRSIKIESVTVTFDEFEDGKLVNNDHPVTLKITDELIAAIKPLLVVEGYNLPILG